MLKRIFVLCLAGALVWGGIKAIYTIFPLDYSDHINLYAENFGLPPSLVYAQVKAESGFDKNAISKKGALGLMQLMPETGKWCAEKTDTSDYTEQALFEPETNIKLGCWYLKYLLDKTGDINWALAAYNAGLANVNKWKDQGITRISDIPFPETRQYVEKVTKYQKIYKKLYKKELKS